jgi:hypothetical protein
MTEKVIKSIALVLGAGLVLYFGYWFFVIAVFTGLFESHYDKQDLIKNYQTKRNEIEETKAYFVPKVPVNTDVEIEFEGDNELAIFHVVQNGKFQSNWNLKTGSGKVDSLLTAIGWDQKTLKTLKNKLDKANCISIASGEPVTVGFQRSAMGMYFYKLFDTPLSDSLKSIYNDGCTYSFYQDKVVLEYGGGAVGSQCFEDYVNK